MKWLILVLILFLVEDSFLQTSKIKQKSTLEKYSYFLVGIKTVEGSKLIFPIGTCFFVRREKNLFLITAKHCINGYNTFNKKPTPSQFDTIGFRYYNSITKQLCFSSLSIRSIKKWLPNNYFYDSPDLIVMQMHDTLIEQYINSLECYMFDNKQEDEIFDSVLAIGYAFQDTKTISLTTLPTYYKGVITHALNSDPFYPHNDSIYYTIQPKSVQGMSGAPIFLQYRSKSKKNKREHFLFGGVLFGTNADYNLSYVVNPELVKLQIKKFVTSQK